MTVALKIGENRPRAQPLEKGRHMALSRPNPVSAFSLSLQLRTTKSRDHRPRWISDWVAVRVLVLLLTILAVAYIVTSANSAVENTEQETAMTGSAVAGVLRP